MSNANLTELVINPILYSSIGSISERLILHPLDTVISFQQRKAQNSLQAATSIYKEYGIAGYYRGLSLPLIFYSVPAQITMFASYSSVKKSLSEETSLTDLQAGAAASIVSGLLCSVVFCPMDAKRLRDTFGIKIQQHTSKVIFRGFIPTLIKSLIHTPIALFGGDVLTDNLPQSNVSAFISGLLSGSIAQIFTTPVDVVKTLVQSDYNSKFKLIDHCRQVYREKSYFKSLNARMIRNGLSTSIILGISQLLEKNNLHQATEAKKTVGREYPS